MAERGATARLGAVVCLLLALGAGALPAAERPAAAAASTDAAGTPTDAAGTPTDAAGTPTDAAGTPTDLHVAMTATPASLAVGDELAVVIAYRWPAGWTPVGGDPDPTADFADEFATAAPPPAVARTGGFTEHVFRITLLARRSGTWPLPRPAFAADGPAGRIRVQAPAVIIAVGATAAPAQPAPPRALWTRPVGAEPTASRWWLALPVGCVAAAVALWLALRRSTAPTPASPAEVFAAGLADAARARDGKDAGARLSLALRRYAGATWRFDGAGSTSREVATHLRQRVAEGRLDEEERLAWCRLLDRLDGLRWAADDLASEAVAPLLEQARVQVDASERLRRQAEAAAQAARAPLAKAAS